MMFEEVYTESKMKNVQRAVEEPCPVREEKNKTWGRTCSFWIFGGTVLEF